MKNLIKVLTVISIFAFVDCASTASFAQKHSKNNSAKYSSAPSHNYSNFSDYSGKGEWKVGGDFGLMFSFLKNSSGISPYMNALADYSTSNNFGIEAKLCWNRFSNSGSYGDIGSSAKTTVGIAQSSIGIGVSARYDFTKNVFMTAGPRLYLPIGGMTLSADQNDGVHNQHGEATYDNVTSVTFGFEIGAGYRFHLTNSMQIVPRVSYQFIASSGTQTDLGNGLVLSPSSATCFQISVGIMSSL